jgi:retinoid hydroxylase
MPNLKGLDYIMSATPSNSNIPPKLPPGNEGLPLIGETLQFFQAPLDFGKKRRAKYGSIYLTNILGTRTINVSGTKANQWVFSGEGKYLTNRWIYTIRRLLGEKSLAMIDGEAHRKRRAMLVAHFKYEAMSVFAPIIQDITAQHLARWSQKQHFVLADAMRELAFEVIAAFLFGEQRHQIDLKWLSGLFLQWTAGMFSLPINVPLGGFGKAIRAKKTMFDYITNLIEERRKSPVQHYDILNALINTRDENGQPLPIDVMVDDVQLLLFAGHDTTVSSNTYIMMMLAQHPQVVQRLREEQATFSETDLRDLEKLKEMSYLDAVIMETLRLYPPVVGLFRQATEDTTFMGYDIPKGCAVNVNPSATHDDPALWQNVQAFDPSRFERGEHKQEAFKHIPFGGGPRMCIGQNFAMIEMRIILAMAIRHYQWQLEPNQDLSVRVFPVVLPKSGAVVNFGKQA